MAIITNDGFSELVERYEKLVYTICRQLLRDDALAEDMTQETFLSAYTHLASCPAGYEKQWLARIASNKAKDCLSSAYARRTVLPGDEKMAYIGGGAPPEEKLLADCGEADIRRAIYSLREPYRQICILHFIEEKSPDEISSELKRPAKTVYTQLSRAKQILRNEIERSGENGTV